MSIHWFILGYNIGTAVWGFAVGIVCPLLIVALMTALGKQVIAFINRKFNK